MNQHHYITDLLTGCHHGETSAQKLLYEHYYSFALSVAMHYCRRRSEAEEIVQDAFLKLFIQLEKSPFTGDFKKWFRRILVNTSIDHFRSNRIYRSVMQKVSDFIEASTESEAVERLERDDHYRLLGQLSPRYRMVFVLHVMEGYSHVEISKLLGISEGTSRSNFAKARRKLQAIAYPFLELNQQLTNG